jgi:hypothetical protein
MGDNQGESESLYSTVVAVGLNLLVSAATLLLSWWKHRCDDSRRSTKILNKAAEAEAEAEAEEQTASNWRCNTCVTPVYTKKHHPKIEKE